MQQRMLIIGATSMLAHETAKLFAREHVAFALVARNKEKLDAVARDLAERGAAKVATIVLDVREASRYRDVLKQAVDALGGLDVAFIAHGSVEDMDVCEHDLDVLAREVQVNFTSTASFLMLIADLFEEQKSGVIAVITSVSGDRGRRIQYVYGSCKAGLNVFLQGLRQRLYPAHVAVLTIKAGTAHTPMTENFDKRGKKVFFVQPQVVARGIYRAIKGRKNNEVYVPWFWWFIMAFVKMIPEPIFKRLKF